MHPFLLVTDLDHTLVGDADALAALNRQLTEHRDRHGTHLVYSTGRSPTSYQQLTTEEDLLEPDVLITSVGTEITSAKYPELGIAWCDRLSVNWHREEIGAIAAQFDALIPQPESEQRPFKVSYFLRGAIAPQVIADLRHALQHLETQVIYSGGKDLDILPVGANKGHAMEFVRSALNFAPDRTVACGDSGNDLALFRDRPERGIIVANAQPDLLEWHRTHGSPHHYLAKTPYAQGILEGLRFFELLSSQ